MTRRATVIALGATVALQLAIMCAGAFSAWLPLWQGQEIRLKTVPVDPRSLLRGNYARLHYDISQIDLPAALHNARIRRNEPVYVQLKKGKDGLYEYHAVAFERPNSGLYLRGRIVSLHVQNRHKMIMVKYGIEAFFAEKKQALALEEELREGGIAVLMVMKNGKATLKDVQPHKPGHSLDNS